MGTAVRPNSLAAVALGALVWLGGSVLADGAGDASSACYSYREAKARWSGAYLTWRYDSRKWQCWAPRGHRGVNYRGIGTRGVKSPNLIPTAEDIAPEFPQPEAIRIEQPTANVRLEPEPPVPIIHFEPSRLGWVWEAKERVQTQPPDNWPETVYSTFDGEPPDVWPTQSKTAGSGLPAVLLLALLAGGGLAMTTAGLLAVRFRG